MKILTLQRAEFKTKKIFFLKSEKMAAASRLRLSVLRALSLESPSCS